MTPPIRLRPVSAAILGSRDAFSVDPLSNVRPGTIGFADDRRAVMRHGWLPVGALVAGLAFTPGAVFAQRAAEPPVAEAVTTLPPISVVGTNSKDYAPVTSTIGGKIETPLRDIPQSVTVIDRAVLDAQGVASLQDALRYVPGITIGSAEGGSIGNNINLRGFSARTDIYLDGMRDRGQYYRDTFSLDSVEVLKGPSSMLFGRGSTGGVINQVSKVPSLQAHNEVTATVGSDDYYRATGDVDVPLAGTSVFRLAVMGQDMHTTRDVMSNQDFGIAPSFRAGIGTPTEFTLSALVLHNHDMPDYGLPPLNGAPAPVSMSNFYGLTDDRTVQDVDSVTARIRHRFDNGVSLRNQTQYNHYTTDAQETGPNRVGTAASNVFTGLPTSAIGNITDIPPSQLYVLLGSHDRHITDSSIYNQTDLVTRFDTGQIRHSMVAGLELGRDRYTNQSYSRVDPTITGGIPGLALVPLEDPVYHGAPANAVRTATNRANSKADTIGVYVNDTIELAPQWKVIAGVREDWFKATIINSNSLPSSASQDVSFTSVRAGVLYQPTERESYYVAYGTSFDPSLEALTLTNGQQNVPPETNKSYEVGAKWDVLQGNLQLAAALFQVDKTNARSQIETGVYDVTGAVRVRGGEVSATGRLTSRWQLIAGYTLLDAEIVSASALDGTQGKVPANTPRHAASLWTTYNFAPQWEAGVGITGTSSVYASNTNVITVPGYARVDATLAYHQPKYDIRLNVVNLADNDYFASVIPSDGGRSVPGVGRTGIITLAYRF